ncbi:MAG: zinc ABC transporter substrate-binding protein [Salinivirgaceae bacterium]|nr:zinc ABC transporter substrate-binding protein [Salinivirgaceae bacterium]MDD4746427.1 zinc ABC transporter substrate-binding protein [Salinivirgaceae bacterium]MDY0280157.1 zinc ABC transporter substrate-binding protein [Salinivirgaceae bacterium]
MRKIGLLTIVALLAISCQTGEKKGIEKPTVSVSLIPQKYWVDKLSGNAVEVNVLVVSGANHSTYEPTPAQMRKINASSLYFKIGHIDFEYAWISKMQNANPKMKVVDLSKDFNLSDVVTAPCNHDHGDGDHSDHHHAHSAVDPHIWLNPPMVREMISVIARELRLLLPENADSIRMREIQFIKEIDSLDRHITDRLRDLENRKILLFHPALTWYAVNYGLEQIVVEVDGKEPSVSKMKQIIETIRTENIKVVMIQSEFSSDRAESIANETGSEIVQIDPMAYDWIDNMYKLTEVIEKSLIKSQKK